MNQGTPKTLKEALRNADEAYCDACRIHVLSNSREPSPKLLMFIESHVRDFLANHFGSVMLKTEIDEATEANAILTKLFKSLMTQETLSPPVEEELKQTL